jgi:hypothetical protein
MEHLFKTIQSTINQSIENYIDRIVEKYSLDKGELMNLWIGHSTFSQDNGKTIEKKMQNNDSIRCLYIPSRGKNSGQQCTVKPKHGGQYCSLHKKYESVEKKTSKTKSISSSKTTSRSSSSVKAELPPKVFKKHKLLDCFYHPETNLVLVSAQEKIVYAKIFKDKIVPLEEEDIETCKKWSFQYKNGEDTKQHINKELEKHESEYEESDDGDNILGKKDEESDEDDNRKMKMVRKALGII